jgi:hypothetical protein
VLTDAGREQHRGELLNCKKCDDERQPGASPSK